MAIPRATSSPRPQPTPPDRPAPEVPPHHAELVHTATAAVCAMAVAPLVWSLPEIAAEPGTEAWQWPAYGLLAAAALYLVLLAGRHLNEAWRGRDGTRPARWRMGLAVASDMVVTLLVGVIYARGVESRALLAGLGTGLIGLLVGSGVSAVVTLGSWWTDRPLPQEGERPERRTPGWFASVVALMLVAGMAWLESRPLPAMDLGGNALRGVPERREKTHHQKSRDDAAQLEDAARLLAASRAAETATVR